MKSWITVILLIITTGGIVQAQPKGEVRQGNKLYKEQKYKEASEAYQKALMKQPNYTPGLFNLGNAQYHQKQYEVSRKLFEGTAKTATEKEQKAAANYNIGNTYLEEKKYKEAIDAYKEALRKNPEDENAKYNLSYALQMMKNQQGNDDNKNDNNKKNDKEDDKKNENKQDKKEDDKQDNKQQQDQQNKKEEEQQQQQDRPQPQPSKLSEQQAEQLLNALEQEEKKLQDKMKKGKAVPIKVEKDW